MATRQQKMNARGYSRVGPGDYLKLEQRGAWMVGHSVCFPDRGGVIRCQRAFPMKEAEVEAVAALAPMALEIGAEIEEEIACFEIGARGRGRGRRKARRQRRRRVMRKLGPKFRKRVNKVAKRIAATKIVRALNVAKAKALQSPLAGAGVAAAARALSAFGVPASVTKLALNQARFAAADRAKMGGAAAMVARFSEGSLRDKAQRQAILQEALRRRKKALGQGLAASVPGANLAKMGAGVVRSGTKGRVDMGRMASAAQRMRSGYDPEYDTYDL